MFPFLAAYIAEFLLLLNLLVRLLKRRRSRYRLMYVLICASIAQVFCCLITFLDVEGLPRFSPLYAVVSLALSCMAICSDVIFYTGLKTVLKQLNLENSITNVAFFLFKLFFVVDAAMLLTNHFHQLAFGCMPFSVHGGPLVLMPKLGLWLQVHYYVLLLQGLTMAVGLLYKSAMLPFLYSGKYLLYGVYLITTYVFSIFFCYVSCSFVVRNCLVLAVSFQAFFLCYFIFYNRPVFTLSYIRQMVIDKLGSPVVLFDLDDLLVDFNVDAKYLFALEPQLINHLTLTEFLKRSIGNQLRERSTSTVEEVSVRDAAGMEQMFKLDYTKLYDKANKSLGTLLLFHNITELKQLYNTMEKTATTDMLTGLASKALLEKKVTEINLYRKYPYCAVVCNINGLRLISEGFGENAGHAATMHVAELLRSKLRAGDFAAYSDGNMVVLMSDTLASEASRVFARISDALHKDNTFNFKLSFEYGVAERFSRDTDMQLTIAQAQSAMLKKKLLSHSFTHESIVDSLQKALRESSFETEKHSLRVQALCVKIADKLNLPADQYESLKLLALFHDIGKLSVPSELLSKPERLTEEERQIMMLHTINGSKVAMASKELAPIARGILCHHEHWDCTGYPNGYAGEEIPFHARIVNVADAYDVMTHDRPWEKAHSSEEAVQIIQKQAGKQFDPTVVNAFLQIF